HGDDATHCSPNARTHARKYLLSAGRTGALHGRHALSDGGGASRPGCPSPRGTGTRADFVRILLSRLPAAPPNYTQIVRLNAQGLLPEQPVTELEAGANRCAIS